MDIVGGDVLKIGYDKEADFVFVGGGGLFQVLQDVVYVCVGGDGFEIEFAAEGISATLVPGVWFCSLVMVAFGVSNRRRKP